MHIVTQRSLIPPQLFDLEGEVLLQLADAGAVVLDGAGERVQVVIQCRFDAREYPSFGPVLSASPSSTFG
jgi:hypothetical protein